MMIRVFIFCLFALCLNAQQINFEDYKSLKFRNIGPAGMSGRVTAIDVDLSNEDRIFLGTASGGVWLSENGGISFKPIFDEQSNLSIGSLKINQANPSEIWVGTGEGNPRNSLNTGNGIYKSIDGGKSWKNMGLSNSKVIHRIIIHKDNSNIVFAASMGSPWGPNEERGVFKTTDGGKSWKKILYINDKTGACDLITDPTNPNKLIACMYEHERKPWELKSGGKGSGLHVSFDAGESWKQINSEDGLPKGDLGRIGVALCKSKPNMVYAIIEAKENGLYKSIDGGLKWTSLGNKSASNRPFYYHEIYVDPINENRIYNVQTYLTKSEDGGKTFKNIADYGNAVHPDHHALWIHPSKPNFIIDGNDGGANISKDMGETWKFISNLPVGQFYHINVDNEFPYQVYGGMQDNGSWVGPSAVLRQGPILNTDFQELYFGDGFDVMPRKGDSRYVYAMAQGGSLGYVDRETGFTKYIKPIHPEGKFLRFNWNSALAQDPFNDCGVYYGSQYVHYSTDCGDSWSIISPDLTSNDSTKIKIKETGGLTPDVTGAEMHCTILAIAPSPKNKNVIWVCTDDGNLQLTRDGGVSWNNVSKNIKDFPKGAWIPQIELSKHNEGEIFIVANDYRRNNYDAYAYHTLDYGKTWNRIADNSKINTFVVSILQDKVEPNLLFLGADDGLYITFNKGQTWQHVQKNFPNVQVSDMKIQERENDLVVSTFGRAIWILDDITPLREIAKRGKAFEDEFKVFNTSEVIDASYKSYQGLRFYAQGDFIGENDNISTANIYVWSKAKKTNKGEDDVKNEKETDKSKEGKVESGKKKQSDKFKIAVLSENGDTVRRFTNKIEGGLQKIAWNLTQDGIRYLSKKDTEKDADLPSGPTVLPGKYKLIVRYNDKKDSTWIIVKPDPRLPFNNKNYRDKIESLNSYNEVRLKANETFEIIKDMKKSIKTIEAINSIQEDSTKEKVDSLVKKINTKVDSLENIFFLPDDGKGYLYDADKFNKILYTPISYMNSSINGITQNSKFAIEQAKSKLAEISVRINDFKNIDWTRFKKEIESLNLRIFKE